LVVGLRNDDTTIEKIAARMGVTPRTMQRRLKDDATSFNALRENVRQELVSEYLDQDLSIAEISFLLGFSQPSAFFRAFKRWTGLTPQESRAQRTSVAT
jgi:AraC-like DNA-binding protein